MIHSAKLDLEQFNAPAEGATIFDFDVWSYWYDNGFPVDDVVEAHSIVHTKPNDKDTAHIVCKVKTLSKTIDTADYVEDATEVWACDCKGYQFHYGVDLEEKSVTEWDHCKHIEAVDPSIKAENDENQETL